MSQTPTPPAAADLGSLLGLREGADAAEWGRIRAAQLFAGRRLALLLLAVSLAGGAAIVVLLRDLVAPWQLASWGAILTAASLGVTFRRLRTHHRQDGYAPLSDVRNTAIEGIALAAAWAVVPIWFCPHLPGGATAGIGLVLAVIMTAGAFAMAPLVLATIGFLATLGSTVAVQLALEGRIGAGIGAVVFTLLLALICVSRARTLVVLRAAELALEERDQTVSLLLREFEETAADWLWETDAARRVVKASPRFAVACGLDPVSINGMAFLQVLAGPAWESGEFAPGLRTLADKLKARDSFRDLRLPVTIDGEERWWELSASPASTRSPASPTASTSTRRSPAP